MTVAESARFHNFSAGPASLPLPVLKQVNQQLLSFSDSCGCSVMEMSHRSAEFEKINREAEADLRSLLDIPSNYSILFMQGI